MMIKTKLYPSHIAIVGGGFTGTSALHQLVHGYPVRQITMFESSGEFGPGFPYQPDESPNYLLNNTNDTMCLDPGNRRAFVEWLQSHPVHSADLDNKGHMPRSVYGEFLRDSVAQASAEAARRGIRLEFVAEEVIDIDESQKGGASVSYRGGSVRADAVILATGRCPDVDLFGLGNSLNAGYTDRHIPGNRLDGLPLDGTWHVIGTSLSAYDVVNALFAPATGCEFRPDGAHRLRFVPNDNHRRIVLCSRGGRLKKCQSRYPFSARPSNLRTALAKRPDPGSMNLSAVRQLIEADAGLAGVSLDWQKLANPYAGVSDAPALNERAADILAADIDAALSPAESTGNFLVDYLDAAQFDLWDLFAAHVLPPGEEETFRSQMETAFLSFAAPSPISTAQKILALMEAGHLRIVHGVESISENPKSGQFDIKHAFGTEHANNLINATAGVDRRVSSGRQPELIRNLVRKGLLRPYTLGDRESNGIAVDMRTFAINPDSRIFAANMLLWGPGLYVSSAISMATIVARILHALYE
jgi:uncharacterized NAD(P)/FAD-binding protein YdhS